MLAYNTRIIMFHSYIIYDLVSSLLPNFLNTKALVEIFEVDNNDEIKRNIKIPARQDDNVTTIGWTNNHYGK